MDLLQCKVSVEYSVNQVTSCGADGDFAAAAAAAAAFPLGNDAGLLGAREEEAG